MPVSIHELHLVDNRGRKAQTAAWSIPAAAAAAIAVVPPVQAAAPMVTRQIGSNGSETYACIATATKAAPVGRTVTFTGTLSERALKNLASWTKDANAVCLERYVDEVQQTPDEFATHVLEGACARVCVFRQRLSAASVTPGSSATCSRSRRLRNPEASATAASRRRQAGL